MSQSTNRTQINESLSALVDDEATELEVRRLLQEAQQDEAIRERWHRYQLARAAIKGEAVSAASMSFADGIREAVSTTELDEPVQSREASTSGWKSNVGRLAIAASVGAVVLVGAQQLQLGGFGPGSPEELAQQAPEALPAAPSSINVPTINVQNVSGGDALPSGQYPRGLEYSPNVQQQQLQDEQIRQYIRHLMREHAESAAQNSGAGLLPYTRVPADEER